MNKFTDILSNLSEKHLHDIANIIEPNVRWKLIKSANKWNGFDLINEFALDEFTAKHYCQIDYRENINEFDRFRYFDEYLNTYIIDFNKYVEIIKYIDERVYS